MQAISNPRLDKLREILEHRNNPNNGTASVVIFLEKIQEYTSKLPNMATEIYQICERLLAESSKLELRQCLHDLRLQLEAWILNHLPIAKDNIPQALYSQWCRRANRAFVVGEMPLDSLGLAFKYFTLARDSGNLASHYDQNWEHISPATLGYLFCDAIYALAVFGYHISGMEIPSTLSSKLTRSDINPNRLKFQLLQRECESGLLVWYGLDLETHRFVHLCADHEVPESVKNCLECGAIGQIYLIEGLRLDAAQFGKWWIQPDSICIFEPDLLVDVTAIAGCFQMGGRPDFQDLPPNHQLHLFKLFSARGETRVKTILGNLLNTCMDELLHRKYRLREQLQVSMLDEIIRQTLRKDLLRLMAIPDANLRQIGQLLMEGWTDQAETRWASQKPGLKIQLQRILELIESSPGRAYWEVPLVSHIYGLNGRSDIQFVDESGHQSVVELKSGTSDFGPRELSWVSPDHRVQIQLYDLIYRSLNKSAFVQRYAWYTGKSKGFSRSVAKANPMQIRDFLVQRNHIAQRLLSLCEKEGILNAWSEIVQNQDKIPSFNQESKNFAQSIDNILVKNEHLLFREYLLFIVQMIAREAVSAQIEAYGNERSFPGSVLWSKSILEKSSQQNVLYDLTLGSRTGHFLLLEGAAGQFSRFRKGDRLVMYVQPEHALDQPYAPSSLLHCHFDAMLRTENEPQLGVLPYKIRVKLDSMTPDMESQLDKKKVKFVLEVSQLSGAASFARIANVIEKMPLSKRELWLGQRAPVVHPVECIPDEDERTAIARHAVAADDLFLIQGPPGCGKTSHLIPALIEQSLARAESEQKRISILILAFTNQATYAICRSLSKLKQRANIDFVHLGKSPVDLGYEQENPWYESHNLNQLLNLPVNELKSIAIHQRLLDCQIVVSTIASASEQVFHMKKFDVLILDEASQVHEMDILTHVSFVPKWILIGDHKQLPPVISQNENVELGLELLEIGFGAPEDSGQFRPRPLASVMERLWRLAKAKEKQGSWPCCTAMVTRQFRMHPEIQAFPSRAFYQEKLLAGLEHYSDQLSLYTAASILGLDQHRIMAIGLVGLDRDHRDMQYHAVKKIIAEIVKSVAPKTTIGLIMPFRADLSSMYKELLQAGLIEDLEKNHAYKQDTVERFQGDEKDIIIYVPGVLSAAMLSSAESILPADPISGEPEVDCKLNVAWTRAREQLLIVGNFQLLQKSGHYQKALDTLAPSQFLRYEGGNFLKHSQKFQEETDW